MTPMYPNRPESPPQRSRLATTCLPISLALAAVLAACGGGSGGGGSPGSGSTGNAGPAQYYLSGPEGVDRGSGLSLAALNPATAPQSSILASSGWQNIATIAQWSASAGSATRVGTRYRVWVGSDNFLHRADLAVASGASAPTVGQLSNLSVASGSTCTTSPSTILDDYANPANSALVYSLAGGCGGTTDQFSVVPLSADAATAPGAASLNEPVAAVHDAGGAITQVLFLQHAAAPAKPTIAVAPSATAAPTTIGAPLNGLGINSPGIGDFESLAVVPEASGSVWLYRDLSAIYAVNLASATPTQVAVFSAPDTDTIVTPAIVDGTTVYIGLSDSTNVTNKIVRVDTTNPSANSGVVVVTDSASGVRLLGVAGGNLLYLLTTGSGGSRLNKVDKTAVGAAAGIQLDQTIAGITAFEQVTAIVGSGIYYTIDTTTGGMVAPQAYYLDATGTARTAVGAAGSQVLGGVLAAPASTLSPGTPLYASAVIALLSTNSANPYAGAAIGGFSGGATVATSFGTLPALASDTYSGLALSEPPLQAGMPALVLASGSQQIGNAAGDLFLFTPGTAGGLLQVTTNLQ